MLKSFLIKKGIQKYLTNLIFKKLELSQSNFDELFKYAKKIKIKISSSVFDLVSAKYLLKKKTDFIKIPSGEITNLKLLSYLGLFNKRIILSTGASSLDEIQNAIDALKKSGTHKKKFLYCIVFQIIQLQLIQLILEV